jgi:cadmium resistance transport/sequestration family protein
LEIIITSILAFISTNIDDIFILTLFYGSRRFRNSEIIIGQLLGIGALIAISIVASLAGLIIDKSYIGLLGFLPIYLGIRGLWHALKKSEDDDASDNLEIEQHNKRHILSIAGVTIANGGDNIGIYVPLFAALSYVNEVITISIFLLMTLAWCILAKYLTNHPYVAKVIDKYGHIVAPVVLIFLGIFILYESGSYNLVG